MESRAILAVAVLAASVAWGAAADGDAPRVLRVPEEFATIQAAVDEAQPGDTVLVSPGVYREAVFIDTPGITLRGTARDEVILEGGGGTPTCDGLSVGVKVYRADNVTISDLTARNYASYGFYWFDLQGFYGHRLNSIDACTYGILTHDAEVGEIAYSEASGSGDSGLYTGEADDCRCVLHHNDIHGNMIGYSGTKGNHVTIRDNWFHDNGVGILPNTLTPDAEHYAFGHLLPGVVQGVADPFGQDPPMQCCVTIVGNLIEDNNNADVPPAGFTETIHLPIGTGIELAGASGNVVFGNVIRGHDRWGVALHWLFVAPNTNVITQNTFEGNAQADLWWDGWGVGNCAQDNGPVRSDPDPFPTCGPLPSVGIPDPRKDAELALIALGHHVGL